MEEQKNNFIKSFNPIWFATVLGFGGIALGSVLMAEIFHLSWLKLLAIALAYFNLALVVFLFFLWGTRAILYFKTFTEDLQHPVTAGFHSLMPAALVMVSLNFSKIGQACALFQYQNLSIAFWIVGASFEFILFTLAVYFLIVNQKMNINFINGGWLVPPVAALLTTIAGLNIIPFIADIATAENILWLNYFFFGMGAFIFILIAVSISSKIFFSERLDPKVFPSVWILLVPFSLISLSLPLLANATGLFLPDFKNALMGISLFLSPMLIGIGVWLLIILILLTYDYFKKGLPYAIGWWAFIFPTASVCIASLTYATLAGQPFFEYLGAVIYVFLLVITFIVLIKTIQSFRVK
ncbi:MAG: hypothetical protein JW914_08325 [Syntrophaceae bacterium]|nr:hypothetical protein [Syntrophaceae bacterium]